MTQGLGDQRRVQQAETTAPLGFGYQDARDTEFRQRLPDAAIVRALGAAQFPYPVDRDLVCQKTPNRLFEQELIFREAEISSSCATIRVQPFG